MPILSEEPSFFPATLLGESDTLLGDIAWEPTGRRWWALYTRARQEKAISRALLARQIPFYLPLIKKTSVIRGRSITSHIPLFAGYVFLYGSDEERVLSLTTNRISRILTIHDVDNFWHDLRQIHRLISSNAALTVESRLIPGNRVRVTSGPFAGIEGTVLTRRNRARLLVSVDFLQQGASVEIDDFLLEPVD